MEQGILYEVFGLLASFCMIFGYLPQAIHTIRTQETDSIALPTFLMMGAGSVLFIIQAIMHKPDIIWSLLLTSLVTAICSCIVFGVKLYNDYFKKRSK